MYDIDGFKPVYSGTGQFCGIQARDRIFETTNFKVWFGAIRRRMFVCKGTGSPLYHYSDQTDDVVKYWYSKDHDDWNGFERIKAKEIKSIEELAEEDGNDL